MAILENLSESSHKYFYVGTIWEKMKLTGNIFKRNLRGGG